MNFLLYVHISKRIAEALAELGHDVVRAALRWPTATDEELLRTAIAEQRIVITQDSDFSELIFAHGHEAPPALIYIRCEPEEQTAIVDRVLAVIAAEPLLEHLVVVTRQDNRYRSFSKSAKPNG